MILTYRYRLKDRSAAKRLREQAIAMDGACTNWAESYFSRLRRAELGHHNHIAGPYLLLYAQGHAWREDARRVDNGSQVRHVTQLALSQEPSVDFQRILPAAFEGSLIVGDGQHVAVNLSNAVTRS